MRTFAPTDAVSSITATMLRALARLPFTDSDTVERNFDAMETMRAHARACRPNGLTTETTLVCMAHRNTNIYTDVRREIGTHCAARFVLVVDFERWFQ
jgi:hypothetical protein